MNISFKNFMLNELGDALTQPTDNVELTLRGTSSYRYHFNIGDKNYEVTFRHKEIYIGDTLITENGYDISFTAAGSMELLNQGGAAEVYRHIILGIRKLVEKENPDALVFYGAYAQQDWMYIKLYERYLKSVFTKVGNSIYLKNEFLDKLKEKNDERWKVIDQVIKGYDYEYRKKALNDLRNKHRAIFAKYGRVVGKIVKANNGTPYYFRSLEQSAPQEGTVLFVYGGDYLGVQTVNIETLQPFTKEELVQNHAYIEELKRALRSERNIDNVEVWVQ